jgi:hypothetical protein
LGLDDGSGLLNPPRDDALVMRIPQDRTAAPRADAILMRIHGKTPAERASRAQE